MFEVVAREAGPSRPSTWLLGSGQGVQVWSITVHRALHGSVLIGDDPPVILLNYAIVGTPTEGAVLCRAMALIAQGVRGFYPLLCCLVH